MKKFAIRFGKLNTKDIFKLIASGALMFGSLALMTDVTDGLAYEQGASETLAYLKASEQFDTVDYDEIHRRGKAYAAKQFLAENEDLK
jgi:hypothetical protein